WDVGEAFEGEREDTIEAIAWDLDGHTVHVAGDAGFRFGGFYTSGYYLRFGVDRLAAPAVNTAPPRIVADGLFLRCDPGHWSGDPAVYRYEWRIDDAVVPDADLSDLLLTAADAGHRVRCLVHADGTAPVS